MRTKTGILIIGIITCVLSDIWTEDTRAITLDGSYRYTYNLTKGHHNEFFFTGYQRLNKYAAIGAGFSASPDALPARFYFQGEILNVPSFLRYRLSILSRDFPDYGTKESSIYPTISLLTDIVELELGLSFRIVNSNAETASLHTLYRLHFNLINGNRYGLGLSLANFDNFRAGNITDIRYGVHNKIALTDGLHIRIDGGFSNGGQLSFASFYSSFFGEIAVRYSL